MISATIKRGVGRAVSEVLFFIGDIAWRVFYYTQNLIDADAEHMHWSVRWLWVVYQWLMTRSCLVQDWGGSKGPWREVTDEAQDGA